MTDDAIRIAVAECLGYSKCKTRYWDGDERDPVFSGVSNISNEIVTIPNYPADLNACAEMEKTINEEQQRFEYWRQLHNVTKPEGYEPKPGCDAHTWGFITATARQRAEAFLRMKLLWKP